MCGCKVRVLRILVDRVNPAVADSDSSEVDPRIVLDLQTTCDVRDIVASITFTSQVDFTPLKLWVLRHKVVKEIVKILGNVGFRPAKGANSVDKAKASAERLVNVHYVGVVVPAMLVAL